MTRKGGMALVCLLALALLAIRAASAADTVRLVMPIVYGAHLPGLGTPPAQLANLVGQASGGTLLLDVKQPGDVSQPQAILDDVSSGKVDAGFATASFWAAKLPAAALFAGYPFGPDAATYMAWFEQGDGRQLYQEMYDQAGYKVHVIPCAFGGAEAAGWFAKEVATPEDLKALRMRIFGLGGRVMSRLGATTLVLAGSGVARAFDKHEIDAAELLTPAADKSLGLQDHAKLIYLPGWQQPETVFELLINQKRWSGLDPARQGQIESACRSLLQSTAVESAALQKAALAELVAKGVRTAKLPDPVLDALRGTWNQVAKEEGDRDLFFRVAIDDLDKFRERSGAPPAGAPPAGAEPSAPPAAAPSP